MPKEDTTLLYFWLSYEVKLSQMFRTWFNERALDRGILLHSYFSYQEDAHCEEGGVS